MPADLLMIVPSRGRPENVRALLEAWGETATGAADIVVALDADDPKWSEYRDLGWGLGKWPEGNSLPLRYTVPIRRRLGGTLNEVARSFAPSWEYRPLQYRAIGFMGDDHLPRTKGWDQQFMAALDDMGTGMVYSNDGLFKVLPQLQRKPSVIAMTSDIIQSLGYMVPGGLVHKFIGEAWLALGTTVDRLRFLPDVVIEHMHPLANKAEMDASYEESGSQQQYEEDRHRFDDWMRLSVDADIARLRDLISRG